MREPWAISFTRTEKAYLFPPYEYDREVFRPERAMSQPLVVSDHLVLRVVRSEGGSGEALEVRVGEVEEEPAGREAEAVHRDDAGVVLFQRLREGHGNIRSPVDGL